MRTNRFRNFLLALLCVASLTSFVYVNLDAAYHTNAPVNSEQIEEIESQDKGIILLPDLDILESLLNRGVNPLGWIGRV